MHPEFGKRWSRYEKPVALSWHIDETYIKVAGEWTYRELLGKAAYVRLAGEIRLRSQVRFSAWIRQAHPYTIPGGPLSDCTTDEALSRATWRCAPRQ